MKVNLVMLPVLLSREHEATKVSSSADYCL